MLCEVHFCVLGVVYGLALFLKFQVFSFDRREFDSLELSHQTVQLLADSLLLHLIKK